MPRSESSVLEKIGTQAFVAACHPYLVEQEFGQGKDFGTDYVVQIFDRTGKKLSWFKAQVKHAPPSEIFFPFRTRELVWEWDNGLPTEPLKLLPYDLDLEGFHQHLQPNQEPIPTLLFLGNEHDIFYVWLQDLYDYYLKWIRKANRESGSIRVYLTNARGMLRIVQGGNVRLPLRPNDPGVPAFHYDGTQPSLSMNAPPVRSIDEFCQPGNIDSLCNLGVSMYLQNVRPRSSHLQEFDIEGYWKILEEKIRGGPWIATLFARFLGLLVPTGPMVDWATPILERWECPYRLPAAIQMLAQSPAPAVAKAALKVISDRLESHTWLVRPFVDPHDPSAHRLEVEYYIALSRFLSLRSCSGDDDALNLLIDVFLEQNCDERGHYFAAALAEWSQLSGAGAHGRLRIAAGSRWPSTISDTEPLSDQIWNVFASARWRAEMDR